MSSGKLLACQQVQAVAHYDDVRLKSEKAGIYIVTYSLLRAADHGELLGTCSRTRCCSCVFFAKVLVYVFTKYWQVFKLL